MTETKMEIQLPESPGQKTTQVFEQDGKKYILFVEIHYDQDVECPLEEGTGNGNLYHHNHRLKNYNPAAMQDAVDNPDHVKLSYYEHGRCRWSVMGDTVPGEEFQWDGARFAGVWVPDKDSLANIDYPGTDPTPEARRQRILDYAKGVMEQYTDWANGDVFGYDVALYKLRTDDDGDPIQEREYYDKHAKKALVGEDSCWGFYGWDYFLQQTREAAEGLIPAEQGAA